MNYISTVLRKKYCDFLPLQPDLNKVLSKLWSKQPTNEATMLIVSSFLPIIIKSNLLTTRFLFAVYISVSSIWTAYVVKNMVIYDVSNLTERIWKHTLVNFPRKQVIRRKNRDSLERDRRITKFNNYVVTQNLLKYS